jgi:ribosomal protein S14
MAHNRPHHVYMTFFLMGEWQVQFLSSDFRPALPNKLTVADPENIREWAMQGLAMGTPESWQIFQHAIDTGKGVIHLKLTRNQFRDLAERLSMRVTLHPRT